MITITQALMGASNKRLKRVWQRKASEEVNTVLYAMGRKKPHFPVPVIVYTDCEMGDDDALSID